MDPCGLFFHWVLAPGLKRLNPVKTALSLLVFHILISTYFSQFMLNFSQVVSRWPTPRVFYIWVVYSSNVFKFMPSVYVKAFSENFIPLFGNVTRLYISCLKHVTHLLQLDWNTKFTGPVSWPAQSKNCTKSSIEHGQTNCQFCWHFIEHGNCKPSAKRWMPLCTSRIWYNPETSFSAAFTKHTV